MIQDLWSECRSGFANSTWTAVPYPEDEPAGPAAFMRLDLPFEWAGGMEIYVGHAHSGGVIEGISLRYPATGQRLSIAVIEPTWNASFPDMALSPDLPPFSPPPWEGWTYQSNIGVNSNHPPGEQDGRYVESLTGPNGFELLQLPQ